MGGLDKTTALYYSKVMCFRDSFPIIEDGVCMWETKGDKIETVWERERDKDTGDIIIWKIFNI